MNIEMMSISDERVKESLLSTISESNDNDLVVTGKQVRFRPASDNTVLLLDNDSHHGVLIEKANIASMFPSEISIRDFRQVDRTKFQLKHNHQPEALQAFVRECNSKRNIDLVKVSDEFIRVPEGIPEDLGANFHLFCKVYGFWVLDIEDVQLSQPAKLVTVYDDEGTPSTIENPHYQNVMYITVVATHPVYQGTIEVKV